MSTRWGVFVPLLLDELFSSWLARTALTLGCDPLVLTGAIWPGWRVWTNDPDRGLSAGRAAALAKVSGIEVSMFEAASLRPVAAAITPIPLDRLAIWPWILALGARNRKRHGGLQYCPLCLREDQKPYYRRQWRLGWHTNCSVHGVRLLDKCPNCSAPIEPHRLQATDENTAICATCKWDLRKFAAAALVPEEFFFQREADEVLRYGWGSYGINRFSVSHWFELAGYFVMLLRRVALNRTGKLAAFLNSLGVDVSVLRPPATGLVLETLPVEERDVLLGNAWKIFRVGPGRFLSAAMETSLTQSYLHCRHKAVPKPITKLMEMLPAKNVSRMRRTLNVTSQPRSPQVVMRMFARLQRKLVVVAR